MAQLSANILNPGKELKTQHKVNNVDKKICSK